MYNVTLVGINSKYIHSALAIYYLKAGVLKYAKGDYHINLHEFTIHQSIETMALAILKDNPDLVGISSYIWNIEVVYALVDALKKQKKDLKIVLGGPEVSYNQKEVLMAHENVDYILAGEGELPFAALCDALSLNEDLKKVEGLSYKDEDYVIKEAYIAKEDPPNPYDDDFIKGVNGRIVYFETTRGCPYACDFCLSGRCGSVRFFDLESAFENLIKLANSGSQTIKFVDRTFNANRKRSLEIIRFIIKNNGILWPEGITFHFEIAGDILDEETIQVLKKAPVGLFQLEIGMQSFNEKTLSYINRKTNTSILKKNILSLLENQNMHIHIDLIVGLAYEGMQELKESFNTAYGLNAHMLQLGFLKILHGAKYEDRQKYPLEYDPHPPYEVLETPWLNKEEMRALHHLEDVLDRMNNSGRFLMTIDYLLKVSQKTAFDLLFEFGNFAYGHMDYKIDLDAYSELIYTFFKDYEGVSEEVLKDYMILDRLSTINTGRLPACLKRKDLNIKQYRLALNRIDPEKKGVKRGFEILVSQKRAVYVDYLEKNKITGKYPLKYIDLSVLENG